MAVFSDTQMTRPIFEEMAGAHQRDDERSEPLGFVVGGMGNLSRQHLGQQYFNAAHALVDHLLQGDGFADYELANPVLFLYRHSIELFLKAILRRDNNTHLLKDLTDEYEVFVKTEFDSDVPDWILNRIKELAAVDPASIAFRYSENRDMEKSRGKSVVYKPVDGELHVDLKHLQSAMSALNVALVGMIACLACGEGKSIR